MTTKCKGCGLDLLSGEYCQVCRVGLGVETKTFLRFKLTMSTGQFVDVGYNSYSEFLDALALLGRLADMCSREKIAEPELVDLLRHGFANRFGPIGKTTSPDKET